MKIYHYNLLTKEFTVETEAKKSPLDGEWLIPSYATTIKPPEVKEKEVACFIDEKWEIFEDHRNEIVYDISNGEKGIIRSIGKLSNNITTQEPPTELKKPVFKKGKWVETAIVYKGIVVENKEDVDRITSSLINGLGEEKAKTEKMIAGNEKCDIWDEFIISRNILLQEGRDFIKENFNEVI